MLVRLLVVALMLAGPIPARVCICAAATAPKASGGPTAPESISDRGKGCGCGHRPGATPSSAFVDTDPADGHTERAVGVPARTDRHAPDCPAINPRPAVSAGVLTPAADLPDAPIVGLFASAEPPSPVRRDVSPSPRYSSEGSAVPLYLSLLSLRI